MKPLLAILIVLGVGFVGWRLFDYYGKLEAGKAAQTAEPVKINPDWNPLPPRTPPATRTAPTGPST